MRNTDARQGCSARSNERREINAIATDKLAIKSASSARRARHSGLNSLNSVRNSPVFARIGRNFKSYRPLHPPTGIASDLETAEQLSRPRCVPVGANASENIRRARALGGMKNFGPSRACERASRSRSIIERSGVKATAKDRRDFFSFEVCGAR